MAKATAATSDPMFFKGHRQRLIKKFLNGQATQYETLELLLTYAVPRRSMRIPARTLLKTFGSGHQVMTAPFCRLMETKDIGPKSALLIKLVHAFGIFECAERLASLPVFHDEKILANYCKFKVGGKNVEEFHVLYLDHKQRMITDDLHTIGTIDYASIYPREILSRALYLNAHSVLIYHNHPQETARFSSDDINATKIIMEKLAQNDVILYDHYLVAGTTVLSMRNTGDLNKSRFC